MSENRVSVSPAVSAGGGAARGPIEHSTEYPAKEWTEWTEWT